MYMLLRVSSLKMRSLTYFGLYNYTTWYASVVYSYYTNKADCEL